MRAGRWLGASEERARSASAVRLHSRRYVCRIALRTGNPRQIAQQIGYLDSAAPGGKRSDSLSCG